MVPPPVPTYHLHLHIYNNNNNNNNNNNKQQHKLNLKNKLQLAISGATLTSMSSFVMGWVNTTGFSLGAVQFVDSIENWRVHYIVNVTSSATNQANCPYNLVVCTG